MVPRPGNEGTVRLREKSYAIVQYYTYIFTRPCLKPSFRFLDIAVWSKVFGIYGIFLPEDTFQTYIFVLKLAIKENRLTDYHIFL